MAYLGPRRSTARKEADHALEQALNRLKCTKRERTLAREIYNSKLSGKRPTTYRTAQRAALQAVNKSRSEVADTSLDPA